MESVEEDRRTSRPRFDLEKELDESRYQDFSRNSDSYDDSEYIDTQNPQPAHDISSIFSNDPDSTQFPNLDAYKDITLGQYIVDRVGDAIKGLFRNSQTILRVDLRQAIRYDGPAWQQKRTPVTVRSKRAKSVQGKREALRGSAIAEDADVGAVQSRGWFHGLQGGGARLKLMQIWEFKDPETGQDRLPLSVNFGFGTNVAMDCGEARPKLRIRTNFAAFHFFPEPYLELRCKWPLGDTNLAVRARYRIPVSSMDGRFWESSTSQLMVNLFHRSGTLFHLTPRGIDFEDQRLPIGQYGTMRIAASVDFPRQLPLEEGEQPFRLRIMRLGLKSRIM